VSEEDSPELAMLKALCEADPVIRDNFPAETKSTILAKYLFTELSKYSTPLGMDLFAILTVPITLNTMLVAVLQKVSKETTGKYHKETEQKMAKVAEEILKGLENKDEEGDNNAPKDNG